MAMIDATNRRTVGVLGGMGPLATIDFLRTLVLATPATCDQEHIPLIVRFCPEVPDRVEVLEGSGPSPELMLVRVAQGLQHAGAECLAVPCNTVHIWHDAIAHALRIPILHIADAALAAVPAGRQVKLAGGWEVEMQIRAYRERPTLARPARRRLEQPWRLLEANADGAAAVDHEMMRGALSAKTVSAALSGSVRARRRARGV